MNTVIIILLIIAVFGYYFRREIKDKIAPDQKKNYTVDDHFNSDKREREKEIDQLLSKIGQNGLGDLTEKERKRLDELSKK